MWTTAMVLAGKLDHLLAANFASTVHADGYAPSSTRLTMTSERPMVAS
jgi:hypothetical protein